MPCAGRLLYVQPEPFEKELSTQQRMDKLKAKAEHFCSDQARQQLYKDVEAGQGMPVLVLRVLGEGGQAIVYATMQVQPTKDLKLFMVPRDARQLALKVSSMVCGLQLSLYCLAVPSIDQKTQPSAGTHSLGCYMFSSNACSGQVCTYIRHYVKHRRFTLQITSTICRQ